MSSKMGMANLGRTRPIIRMTMFEPFARPVFGHSGKLVGALTGLGLKGQINNSPIGPTATALAGSAIAAPRSNALT